jgi:hypothetical protein
MAATTSFRLHAPREPEIRRALKAWLAPTLPPGAVVVDELGIKHGEYRVDLCAVGRDLHGFEIKSDEDTLKRLPAQAKHFSLVFGRMTLVVGPGLLASALALVPPWWGVLLVTVDDDGATRFAELRAAAANPKPNYRWVVRLLWRDELTQALKAKGDRGWSKLRYHQVATRMLAVFAPEELVAIAAAALRTRKGGAPDPGALGAPGAPAPTARPPVAAPPVPEARPWEGALPAPVALFEDGFAGLGGPPAPRLDACVVVSPQACAWGA